MSWTRHLSGINLHQVCLKSEITFIKNKIEKPNTLKTFGSNKSKGPKQHCENHLRSPMSDICLREETFSFNENNTLSRNCQ